MPTRHLRALHRSAKTGAKSCYEVNIFDKREDPSYGTGAVVYFAGSHPMPKAGGKWNTYEITAKGRNIVVTLNGQKPSTCRAACSSRGRSDCSTALA